MTKGLGNPFSFILSNLVMNLSMTTCISFLFSSNLCIRSLLVRTLFTSRIVAVPSSISSSYSWYLFFEFKNWMSLVASLGLLPNSIFTFSIASVINLMRTICSNITCMDGQISLIESMILDHSFSLDSPRGSFSVKSLSINLRFSFILAVFYSSSFYIILASL